MPHRKSLHPRDREPRYPLTSMQHADQRFISVVEDIRALRIQGAHAICVAAVREYAAYAQTAGVAHQFVSEYLACLHRARDKLFEARPTEPALRNSLNYIFTPKVYASMSLEDVCAAIKKRSGVMLSYLLTAKKKIAHVGAKKIKNGMVIYTHCHSSTVVDILREAHHAGKRFTVVNTETRPLFQGRITARELAEDGIPVHHFVDSAIRIAIKQADLALIGTDAIDYDMKVYNKIGSEMIAEIASNYKVPVYACTEAIKYDAMTSEIHKEKIEERSPDEVWSDAPEGVVIQNFAFEKVDPTLIAGIISELGIQSPKEFRAQIRKRYPEWFGTKKH
ncbi:MAG: translation initiation factor eIF-2B [Nanoarchaeota archaeon]